MSIDRGERDARGFLEYIKEYFEAFTSESAGFMFATQQLSMKKGEIEGVSYRSVAADLHLAPFQANLYQQFEVVTRRVGDRFGAEVVTNRRSGNLRNWTQ